MILAVTETAGKVQIHSNFDSLIERWIRFAQVSAASELAYRKGIKNLLEYCKANNILTPNREDLVAYREYLARTYRPTTSNLYISATRLFLKFLYTEKFISFDATMGLKGFKSNNLHKKSSLTVDQIRIVSKSFDTSTLKGSRDMALFALMCSCGLRAVEVTRLDIGDLECIGDKFTLRIWGKGHLAKDTAVVVPVNVYNLIARYLAMRGNVTVEAPLFASCSRRNLGGRLTTASVSRIVKLALQDTGIKNDRLSCHSCRHSAATLALKGGAPLMEVQQLLRHKSLSVTMIYVDELSVLANTASSVAANAIGF